MIKFNKTMSELECLSVAKDNILRNIKNNSSGVLDLNNSQQIKNRIVETALSVFVNRNYHKESIIECDDRAIHYGKPKGTVIKTSCGVGELSVNKHAEHLKALHTLANNLLGLNNAHNQSV